MKKPTKHFFHFFCFLLFSILSFGLPLPVCVDNFFLRILTVLRVSAGAEIVGANIFFFAGNRGFLTLNPLGFDNLTKGIGGNGGISAGGDELVHMWINGKEITNMTPAQKLKSAGIAYIPQTNGLRICIRLHDG